MVVKLMQPSRSQVELSNPPTEEKEIHVEVEPSEATQEESLPEHNLESGLTDAQAEAQLKTWGYNEIPEKKRKLWKRVVAYFYSPMSLLMELAGLLAGLVQSWVFTLVMYSNTNFYSLISELTWDCCL